MRRSMRLRVAHAAQGSDTRISGSATASGSIPIPSHPTDEPLSFSYGFLLGFFCNLLTLLNQCLDGTL